MKLKLHFSKLNLRHDIIIYILLCVGFFAYKLMELSYPAIPFLHAYFEDLIALPIVLKTALLTGQSLRKPWRSYVFGKVELAVITVLFALYFEWILPSYNPLFTTDALDFLCYGLGTLVFWRWLNRPFPWGI